MLSNEEVNKLKSLDLSDATCIADRLNSTLDNLYITDYLLDEAFNLGYYKATKLLIKILKCSDEKEKNMFIEQLNSFDIYVYDKYSCRSRFVEGYKKALKNFS